MTHAEIVKKLIGNIHPYGDSQIDVDRTINLEEMCLLVNDLVSDIKQVAEMKDRHEYSIKRMGEYASDFLVNTLGIKEE